jgi:hypothetical protein
MPNLTSIIDEPLSRTTLATVKEIASTLKEEGSEVTIELLLAVVHDAFIQGLHLREGIAMNMESSHGRVLEETAFDRPSPIEEAELVLAAARARLAEAETEEEEEDG